MLACPADHQPIGHRSEATGGAGVRCQPRARRAVTRSARARRGPGSPGRRRSRCGARLDQGQAQLGDVVAQQGRLLVAQLGGGQTHLLLEAHHQALQLVDGERARARPSRRRRWCRPRGRRRRRPGAVPRPVAPGSAAARTGAWPGRARPPRLPAPRPRPGRGAGGPDAGQDVGDRLADGRGVDAVLGVVGLLQGPAALGLGDGGPHGVGDGVGVEHDLAVHVARGAPHGLDERRRRAQEPGLVGVEDGDQLDLGEVETLAQEVDPHEHVVLPEAQVAQQLDAGDGVDVGVQVPHPHAQLQQVVGEVLGHLLGQRGDEDAPARLRRLGDALHEVVDLPGRGLDHHLGVDQSGGPDDLFHHLARHLELVARPAWPTRRSPAPPCR